MKTAIAKDEEREARARRLWEMRVRAGFKSAASAAKHFKWVYSTYAGHENGDRAYDENDELIYAEAYGTTPSYLRTGNLNSSSANARQLLGKFSDIIHVPLLDVTDLDTFEHVIMTGEFPADRVARTEPLPSLIKAGPNTYALAVIDDAMAEAKPRLDQGSIGYFDPDADIATGHVVAATVKGYPQVVLRKYRLMPSIDGARRFDLIATNSDYPSFSSVEHEINLRGRLVGVWVPA